MLFETTRSRSRRRRTPGLDRDLSGFAGRRDADLEGKAVTLTTAGRRPPGQLVAALLVAVPGFLFGAATYLGLPHAEMPPPLAAVVYGVAIIGAAFTLSWGAEAAQVDISAGFAIALLA